MENHATMQENASQNLLPDSKTFDKFAFPMKMKNEGTMETPLQDI
jgi:hypothetical protein